MLRMNQSAVRRTVFISTRKSYNMALKFVLIAVAMLQLVASMPRITLQDLEIADDAVSVGSYIREARAAPPDHYHKSYESDGDGEIGYSRKKQGGGKKGYQHFDSYHKKDGDNYEFAKEDSFGHDDGGHDGAYSHRHEQKAKLEQKPADVEEIDEYGREEQQDKVHEELKEAPDGNGGVEAYGHDRKDYILPEKYTYGGGDEYNF